MLRGIDHIALPMQNVDAMLQFYEAIGADVREDVPGFLHSAYIGSNKINLHLPAAWQSASFTLRGPGAEPGCGDLCLVWGGEISELQALLDNLGAQIIEGPVERIGGSGRTGISLYVRDPDTNLVEFIIYGH